MTRLVTLHIATLVFCIVGLFAIHAQSCEYDHDASYNAPTETECDETLTDDTTDVVYTFVEYSNGQCWYETDE